RRIEPPPVPPPASTNANAPSRVSLSASPAPPAAPAAPAGGASAGTPGPRAREFRKIQLSLAPSAAEVQRERRGQRPAGGPPPPTPDPAVTGDRSPPGPWMLRPGDPSGPSGRAGGNTAGDHKSAAIDASGPQQGVIRNSRW